MSDRTPSSGRRVISVFTLAMINVAVIPFIIFHFRKPGWAAKAPNREENSYLKEEIR